MELVAKIRNARAEANVEPGRWIAADVFAGKRGEPFEGARRELGFLARIADDNLRFVEGEPQATEQAIVVVASDVVAVLPLAGMVDLDAERARLRRELEGAQGEQARLEGQLANDGFVARAPEQVVSGARQKLAVATEKIEVLRRRLDELGG